MKTEQNEIDELLALCGTVEIEDNWQAMRALETLPLEVIELIFQTPSEKS